jgi:hypothetical protein
MDECDRARDRGLLHRAGRGRFGRLVSVIRSDRLEAARALIKFYLINARAATAIPSRDMR